MANERKWDTIDGHSPVVPFFNAVYPMSPEAMEIFDKNTFHLFLEKKKLLLKPGLIADHFYFIVKGVIRGYIKEEGKEITTWIEEENEIVGSIRTLGTDKPCEEYLQALEDCQLIAIPIRITEEAFNTYPETNIIARRLWEYNYRGAEERAYLGRVRSAEKKYNRFINTRPDLMSRVSLKYIASFLGMTVETLCRIRGRQK